MRHRRSGSTALLLAAVLAFAPGVRAEDESEAAPSASAASALPDEEADTEEEGAQENDDSGTAEDARAALEEARSALSEPPDVDEECIQEAQQALRNAERSFAAGRFASALQDAQEALGELACPSGDGDDD